MKLIISLRARNDTLRILEFISEDSPRRAETFVTELYDKMFGLQKMSRVFPILPGYKLRGLRKRQHGPYLIIYAIEGDTAQVVRVLHGSMDIDAALADDARPRSDHLEAGHLAVERPDRAADVLPG